MAKARRRKAARASKKILVNARKVRRAERNIAVTAVRAEKNIARTAVKAEKNIARTARRARRL
jgi:hypothetical protein